MLKNYFKTAWRLLLQSKGYSALNIFGLAIGMAVTLLIGLWVYNEFSYDKFLPDYQSIYQVRRNYYGNGDTANYSGTSLKLTDALRNQVPDMQYVVETDYPRQHGLLAGENKLYMDGTHVGGDFLRLFQFPLVQGSPSTVLRDPYSIVLTESTAKALFGKTDPINKTVRFDNKDNLTVTGVLKDLPANSRFKFNYLVPFAYLETTDSFTHRARQANFEWNGYQTYVQLKPGISFAQVAAKIRDIEKVDKDNIMSVVTNVVLQPLSHWHLYEKFENGKEAGGLIDYVRMFGIVGVLVLLIACINFVNLTTARSEKRAREVGVRKAIGSRKKDLVFQFLIESFLLTALAFIFALVVVRVCLPAFNRLTGTLISIPFSNPNFWYLLLGGVVITALAAGSRPAFYLSSFNPVTVLKGALPAGGSALARKVLVVLQFSCSIALIISTFVIYEQIQYGRNRPVGYSMDRLMMTNMNADLARNYVAIRNELMEKGIAESVTWASSPATSPGWHRDVDGFPGKRPGETVNMGRIHMTEGYFTTLGMTMKEGRDFSGPSDTLNVIFNEAAVKLLRLKDPLHQVITNWQTKMQIIGIVKDALTISPYAPADPTMFVYDPTPQGAMMYRLSPRLAPHMAIQQLTTIFNKYNPSFPFDYQFADASYATRFDTEVLVGKLAALIAGLAVFISCLGLFGLAAYMAERRTREIGIRKVLGASVSQLWFLLSKEFIVLVLVSCIIASPVALYFLKGWLESYTYRITIGAGVFVLAAVMAVAITLITISFQSIRAALINPVKSLRTE